MPTTRAETIPLVDLQAQYRGIREEITQALDGVLGSARFVMGPELQAFENEFAAFCGVPGAVGVASGTAALFLALKACGVGQGDEVVTAANTFIATVEAIWMCGARPVLADIDPATHCLDPEAVRRCITPRTKALVPVHLYGHPADMQAHMALAGEHGLYVVEDAAQAHGARCPGGGRVGALGHLGCFSFFPGKNLGAYGDAGGVTGSDEELLQRVRMLRNHGRKDKYIHEELGYAERMDALQAAILRVKLRHLEAWTEARRRVAGWYDELLQGADGILTPCQQHGVRHVYHLYVIRSRQRDALRDMLAARGVATGVHYPVPLHMQPALAWLGYSEGDFPETEAASREILSLPMYPELGQESVSFIAATIRDKD